MKPVSDVEQQIQQYLELVKENLKGVPADEQQDILEGLEAHIYDALESRDEDVSEMGRLAAVLAQMDSPSSYRGLAGTVEKVSSKRRKYFVPVLILIGVVFGLVGYGLHGFLTMPESFECDLTVVEPVEEKETPRRFVPPVEAPVFADDPRLPGVWTSVDFVADPLQFNPDQRAWMGDLYLKKLTFFPNGRTDKPWSVWSSNQVYHAGDKSISHYQIKTIGTNDYLFFEWMSGDVIFRGQDPKYYVLTRPSVRQAVEVVLEPESYVWLATHGFVAPDFEAYFPDDPQGGKELDALFERQNNPGVSDEELLTTVRNGLRCTSKHRTSILRWVGNRYIWGKSPQNPQAVEIMYQAAQPDDAYGTRHYAVYFGLSVLKDKPANVLQAMANICLAGEDCGRVLWGLGRNKADLRPYLEPHLSDPASSEHDMAVALSRAIDGELDIDKWLKEEAARQAEEQYGDRMPEFRESLLSGSSDQRMNTIRFLLQNYALTSSMDESFIPAWAACASDPEVKVRRETARLVGSRYLWRAGVQNSNAVEIIYGLSNDPDRDVRYKCVYFGLSTLREKSDRIIKRLIELWFSSSYDSNLHGRIAWGLRAPQDRARVEELLMPCLAVDQPADVRAQALQMYAQVVKTDPPDLARFDDIGEYQCAFRVQDSDVHCDELRKDLPETIIISKAEDKTHRGQSFGSFTFKGRANYDAILEFFKENPRFAQPQLVPISPPVKGWTYESNEVGE